MGPSQGRPSAGQRRSRPRPPALAPGLSVERCVPLGGRTGVLGERSCSQCALPAHPSGAPFDPFLFRNACRTRPSPFLVHRSYDCRYTGVGLSSCVLFSFLSGTPHTRTAPPQLVSLQEVQVLLIPRCELKIPCKNIKPLAVGGYICTIFGRVLGKGPQVAYHGNI
eukprot:6537133-Prymnesium_polylepis.2